MTPALWPHQEAARESYHQAVRDGREAGLIVLPTGTGKTALFATLARDVGAEGGKTLVLVHRDELVQQTLKTAYRFWPGCLAGVVQGRRDEWNRRDERTGRAMDLVVASVQSMGQSRLERIPRGMFRLIVPDEAHHAVADGWSRVLNWFTPRFTLGVTATPGRLDGKGLADRFGDRPLYTYSLRQAIKDGRLVNIAPFGMETRLDLDDVDENENGDFAVRKLAAKVNTSERNQIILNAYLEKARGRRAIGFSCDVRHAEDLTAVFRAGGVKTCVVHGQMAASERRLTLADFAAGQCEVCWNCEVLTEGFDDPGVSALLMGRPTQSQSLYVQMVGRGLRLSPGKADCIVLDFTDNCRRHKLIAATDLLGRERSEREDEVAPNERLGAGRRQKRETKIVAWRMAYVCPWPDLPSLDGYAPAMAWQAAPASSSALKYLRTFGVDAAASLTAGEVSYLIDRARELDAAFPAPPSPKQKNYLQRIGAWRNGMTRRDANRVIGQKKKQHRR